jgi:hypothetical protein
MGRENRRDLLICHPSNTRLYFGNPVLVGIEERRQEHPIDQANRVRPLARSGEIEILLASDESVMDLDVLRPRNNGHTQENKNNNEANPAQRHTASVSVMLSGKLMPKGPKGQKRPADVISNAVTVMKIATGEIEDTTPDGKNAAAVALGRRGGIARAKSISRKRRVEIARSAALARHGTNTAKRR